MVALFPMGGVHSRYCRFHPKPGRPTHFLFGLVRKSTGYLRRALDATLCMDESIFFLVLQRRAVFQRTPTRGSPEKRLFGALTGTVVITGHMYDILAQRADPFRQRLRA
jgi:hypothetical protein